MIAGFALASLVSSPAAPLSVTSPDGKVVFSLEAEGHLKYSVTAGGKNVILPSILGPIINGTDLGEGASPEGMPKAGKIDETYRMFGAHDKAVNRANTARFSFVTGEKKTPWALEVRAYDDGVAYRYVIPGTGERKISGEASTWTLPEGSTVWYQGHENRSYEDRYRPEAIGDMKAGAKIMAPATVILPNNEGYAVMTEANVVDYSDMALELVAPRTFQSIFHDDSSGWEHKGEIVSPWRVTLVASDLNKLVNSDIVRNLCPAPEASLANAKWIRPGKSIWHWLTGGRPNLAEQKEWIDGTSALGIEYYLIDDGWKDWDGGGDKAWKALEGLLKHAKEKNVGIWIWLHSREVFKPEDRVAYFKRAKDLGVVGLKIDFPEPANVEWINWYDATLRDAAKAGLMIDFHGAVKPSGRERTWPNEMTREGICGREQGKLPATHDTALPFIRFVQGHADYTPVLFDPEKLNGSSLPHELSMAIVYTSPFLCLGDKPARYLESPAVDIIKALPAVWDETLVLPGTEIGKEAGFARRKGKDWFIGVIGAKEPSEKSITLDFLGSGSYKLVEIADDPANNNAMVRGERTVKKGDTVDFKMREDGGYVAWLVPAKA
jgi:alpha-glucosidase